MKGSPRSIRIDNPKRYRTTRREIEQLVLPRLKADLSLLESLGFDLTGWPTAESL